MPLGAVTTVTEQVPLEALRTCSSEVGLAIGILILIEGVVALVIATAVVVFWLITR